MKASNLARPTIAMQNPPPMSRPLWRSQPSPARCSPSPWNRPSAQQTATTEEEGEEEQDNEQLSLSAGAAGSVRARDFTRSDLR